MIHGDFKPEHVWHNGSSLTVIDLDLSRPADPALDLGKFLGDLPRWCDGIRGGGLNAARERFLAGYAREWITRIEDITPFVRGQHQHVLMGDYERLLTPRETVYTPTRLTQRVAPA